MTARSAAFGFLLLLLAAASSQEARAVDPREALTAAWESLWQQTGYPRGVYKWEGPLRVRYSGTTVERHKAFALQQLKMVAAVAGLEVVESDEASANMHVEFVPSTTHRPYNESCTTFSTASGGVIRASRVRTNEQSVYRCMLHEAMHVMGFPGHPLANTVLTYFSRPDAITEIDRLLLKTLYSAEVAPGSSPLAMLGVLARRLEDGAPEKEKENIRQAAAAFFSSTVREMEAFAAGSGEPPAVLYRSSKATGSGVARGQTAVQYFLGMAYLEGHLVAIDRAKAREWLARAAASSYPGAQKLLATLAPDH